MRRLIIATLLLVLGMTIGLGGPALATHVFSDVGDADTHAPGIDWAAERGLVRGYDDGTYRPANPVSRGQLATILANQGAYTGPVYTLTPACGSLQMTVVEHNHTGSGSASVEYSVDGGNRVPVVGGIPDNGDPFLFTAAASGVVTLFIDDIAWASSPTGETCTPSVP